MTDAPFSGDALTAAPAPGDDRLTASALYRAVLLAFALLVAVLVFPTLAGVLLLVLLIVVVAVPMCAAVDRLQRLHIPRGVGAPLVMLALIAVFAGIITLLVPVFTEQGRRLVHSLPSLYQQVREQLGRGRTAAPHGGGQTLQQYVSGYTNHPQRLLGPATTIGAGVAGIVTTLIVVAITSIYTAIRPEPLQRGVLRLFPPRSRGHARHIMDRLAHAYLGWLHGLVAGMVVLFVVTYVGLRLVSLPYALVFATLTAIAMVVPYYGALVSAIPPILLALTISPAKALIVAGIYIVAHQIEGHLIEPLVMARAVDLHPALVAIGVIAVERMFGPVGLIVAVPLMVTIKVLVEELWVRRIETGAGAPPGERAPPASRFDRADAEHVGPVPGAGS